MTQRPSKLMTPDLAHMILKEIGLPAEYSWVDDERYEAAQYALECMDELRRFREREPLVTALLEASEPFGYTTPITHTSIDDDMRDVHAAGNAVREFKVTS